MWIILHNHSMVSSDTAKSQSITGTCLMFFHQQFYLSHAVPNCFFHQTSYSAPGHAHNGPAKALRSL